jgi:pimeloyl-ACP methyl ester carboxylesterase
VPDRASYKEGACPFDLAGEEGITCGYLTVPAERDRPDSPLIEIPVLILHSWSDNPQPDPIVYFEGGPGGSGLLTWDTWLEFPLRAERDIILFDQRGTGYSSPSLNCIEIDAGELSEADGAKACYDRLMAEGINLAAYNSAASAADANDLRLALGYTEWNLIGISYGTRLALTVMRDFPTGVRSVVLDSVYPPNVNAYIQEPHDAVGAIQAMLAGCAADPACNDAYPDLPARFHELLANLEESPVELDDGTTLDGASLVNFLFNALYETSIIPRLPFVIDQAYYENYDPWLELDAELTDDAGWSGLYQDEDDAVDVSDSEGVYYSVECYEEMPFNSFEEALAATTAYPSPLAEILQASLEEEYEICALWDVGQAAPLETEAVHSDLPTLILAGEYDPVTPPYWGRLAGETLPNHYYFEAPRAGHDIMDTGDCPVEIIAAFITAPHTPPDGSCVAGMALEFELP